MLIQFICHIRAAPMGSNGASPSAYLCNLDTLLSERHNKRVHRAQAGEQEWQKWPFLRVQVVDREERIDSQGACLLMFVFSHRAPLLLVGSEMILVLLMMSRNQKRSQKEIELLERGGRRPSCESNSSSGGHQRHHQHHNMICLG